MSLILDAWLSICRRRYQGPIYDWARTNTDLKPPLTVTGPFDASSSRHFLAPLDALMDYRVPEVNILKPVRGGGTLIANIWVAWARVNDPGPTMFLLQTDPIADDHWNKVLLPTLESVPEIRAMLDGLDRFKKTNRKIEFADGNHLHINGPSIGNLQTNAFRYLVEDECWLYQDKMGDAEGRIGDFARKRVSKVLRVSQGGPALGVTMNECAWVRAYDRGTTNEWEVECLHCQKRYQPVFSGANPDGGFWGITWDHHKFPNGDWNLARCCETVRFECPHCHKPVLDTPRTKGEWNRTGRYAVTEERGAAKNFHWEAVIADPWDGLVQLWLDACNAERRGDLSAKLQFYQKRRAMFKDEESLLKGGLSLSRAIYEIESDWVDEKVRFMTIDRQEEDVFWWTVRAWSDQKSRRLGFGKAFGFSELEEIRKRFKVLPHRTMCDSGFSPKGDNGVYAACVRFGWIALKGDKAWSFVHRLKNGKAVHKSYAPLTKGDPASGTIGQGRRYANLLIFSKNQMNGIVQRLIDSGAWEEPQGGDPDIEKEYNVQMAGRIRKTAFDKTTGETRVFWYESKNDHARDLANMQALGAVVIGIVPDPSLERLTESEQKDATTSNTQ